MIKMYVPRNKNNATALTARDTPCIHTSFECQSLNTAGEFLSHFFLAQNLDFLVYLRRFLLLVGAANSSAITFLGRPRLPFFLFLTSAFCAFCPSIIQL